MAVGADFSRIVVLGRTVIQVTVRGSVTASGGSDRV